MAGLKQELKHALVQKRAAEQIVFDSTYTGPRWRYGLTYRPIGMAQIPKGWIIKSDRKDSRFNHGTVDYPFELSADQVRQFELTPLGKV